MDQLKDKLFFTALCVVCFIAGAALGNLVPLNPPEQKQPITIYTVDNAGGVMTGTITDKEIIEGHYTVTVHAYGKFLVTKQQYESLSVGEEVPEYLKKRGN